MPLLRMTNGFERLSDASLKVRLDSILFSMRDNPSFDAPIPSLGEMQAALDSFSSTLAVAQSGSLYEKALKNQKRQELIDRVHRLSYYVLLMANGDELVAQSSGFTIAKVYTTSEAISKATGLQLSDGVNAGELVLRFDKVKGARSYIYQYAPDPLTADTEWMHMLGTSSTAVITGLKSCQRYWCRVIAIGVRNQQTMSDAVARVVQ